MLLNNFKPLLLFGNNGTLKNVAGDNVSVATFLHDLHAGGAVYNNHMTSGVSRSFNYNTTTASNSFTNEQATYTWAGVVTGSHTQTYYNGNGFVLFVGSGNTEVSSSDYCLDNPLTLDVTSAACYTNADGKVIVQRSFYNNSGSDVTIKEVGCYMFTAHDTGIPIVMIGRRVLPTPVTLPNGETFTFTYTIDMSDVTLSEAV